MKQEEIALLEREWKTREQEWQDLHNQFFSTGSNTPVNWPPRVATLEALAAIEAAKRAEEEAYQRYLDALRGL